MGRGSFLLTDRADESKTETHQHNVFREEKGKV